MPGSLILYLKGMRIMMFQLSGFYYSRTRHTDKPTQHPDRHLHGVLNA